jgi:RNA polymerase sigma factor (sigma-70 family)
MADSEPTGASGLRELVRAAVDGDERAWAALVDRYAGLVVAVCRRWRLPDADLADVSQTVWLRLVEHLGSLREPETLPAWLITTARHESQRVVRIARREQPEWVAQRMVGRPDDGPELDANLLRDERLAEVRVAFADLPGHCQQLLGMLIEAPPASYDDISRRLGMPCGSIGPNRARCLDRLRRQLSLAAAAADDDGAILQERRAR